MQRPVSGLHATPWPTSHCSLTVQTAPMGPGSGTRQVDVAAPLGHTVPALQEPRDRTEPALFAQPLLHHPQFRHDRGVVLLGPGTRGVFVVIAKDGVQHAKSISVVSRT